MVTYAIMLDSVIVAYLQFVIVLIALKKCLVRNCSVCVGRLPQSYWIELCHGNLLNFYCIRNKEIYSILYIQCKYAPQVCMST